MFKLGWWIWIVIIPGALLVAVFGKPPGKALADKFRSLGNLRGKSREEIVAVVGPQKTTTALGAIGAGRVHLSWQVPEYHIILIFNNDICEGIALEQRSFK